MGFQKEGAGISNHAFGIDQENPYEHGDLRASFEPDPYSRVIYITFSASSTRSNGCMLRRFKLLRFQCESLCQSENAPACEDIALIALMEGGDARGWSVRRRSLRIQK
jgi:hypothetical protein